MKIMSFLNRILFLGAGLVFAAVVVEKVVHAFGFTLIGKTYSAGRLLELSAVMVLFVIAMLVREIRDQGKARA